MNLKELILQESFHQNFPLKVDDFIKYCENRGVRVNREHLEYLEKENIFKPIFRINGWDVSNTIELKELYEQGHVENPSQTDFVPWINFLTQKDGYAEEIIHTYYQPLQVYFLYWILKNKLILTPFSFPQNDGDLLIRAKEWRKLLNKKFGVYNLQYQDKFVELLIHIQNKYLPFVKESGRILTVNNILTDNLFEKLDKLQRNIIPEQILESLGIKVEEIKSFRDSVGIRGLSIDPLEKWYDLIKYINYNRRQKLEDHALLAQDFYLISDMLALFLEDLTGEKQLDTGSLNDSMRGRGKQRIYGKKLNYKDRDVLIRILRDYGINPKPMLILIVEGYTEEIAIPIIANAMGISLDKFDIEIVNLRGIDKQPRELIIYHATPDIYQVDTKYYIHPERTKVFIILDDEGAKNNWFKDPDTKIEKMMTDVLSIIQKKKETNSNVNEIFYEKTVKYEIWKNNFEYDNFTDEELAKELNKYGEKYGYSFDINSDEILTCRGENKNLDKFLRDRNSTSLNKREFGEQLGKFLEIEINKRQNKFEDQRPIEQIIEKTVLFTVNNS